MNNNDISDLLEHFEIKALPTSIGEFVCWLLGDCVLGHGLSDFYREREKQLLDRMLQDVDRSCLDRRQERRLHPGDTL